MIVSDTTSTNVFSLMLRFLVIYISSYTIHLYTPCTGIWYVFHWCTFILQGVLEFMTLPAPSDKDTDVVYLVTVIVLRVAGGVGVSAVVTSAMGLLAVIFLKILQQFW